MMTNYFEKNPLFFIFKIFTSSLTYKNLHILPKFTHITISCNFNNDVELYPDTLNLYLTDINKIANHSPLLTTAKKTIVNWNLKKSAVIGCKITLRRHNLYFFFYNIYIFIIFYKNTSNNIIAQHLNKYKNYSFGIRDHKIFPMFKNEKTMEIRGYNITLTLTSDQMILNNQFLKTVHCISNI